MLKIIKRHIFLTLTGISALVYFSGCAHFRPVEPPASEMRAVWLSRFEYCRYTSSHDQDSIRAYISDTIEKAAQSNFNVVIFQIRGSGDAYYRSGIEPWGQLLTGKLGQDPGWDPLEYAVTEAHRQGLELHAWCNTFPAWRGPGVPPETVPRSPFLEHPEWLVCDSSGVPMPVTDHYVSFSPGIPAVHDYLVRIATDVVRRYDIDGFHFDYIRYPEQSPELGYSHDSISVALFNSSAGNPWKLDWEDWQREQLTQFVCKVYDAITTIKPWVKVSAAVIGSYTGNGWTAYNSVYQDARRWTELGKIDFIAPMIYHPRSHPTAPFMKRSLAWKNYYTVDRYVFPGIGSYRYNTDKKPYTWRETEGQVNDLRKEGFPGMVFFSAGSLDGHWESMRAKYFYNHADIPAMDWKPAVVLLAPQNVIADLSENLLTVSWMDTLNTTQLVAYDIYWDADSSLSDSTLLLGTVPADSAFIWSTEWEGAPDSVNIALKARDGRRNESPFSPAERLGVAQPEY
ncbi:MAG: family 10 glycosylhydrolase [Candidatus Neomarinimicrobiota bacterium]